MCGDDVVLACMCRCEVCFLPLPWLFLDVCGDKWSCKKPTDYLDESAAQFGELRCDGGGGGGDDESSASEITYGEVEQRLGQLQDHLNR